MFLGPAGSIRLPNFMMPPLMNNHGNYIVSLGLVCRWLAEKAEALGVEIYPGFAATEVLYNDAGAVIGVATGDMGIERTASPALPSPAAWSCTANMCLLEKACAVRSPSS